MELLTDICSKLDNKTSFADLQLKISARTEDETYYYYLAKGFYRVQIVGLKIALKKDLPAGIDIEKFDFSNVFVKDGIKFESLENESNALLNAMSTLYKVKKNARLKENLPPFLICNLNEKAIDYSSGKYSFKLFMDSKNLHAEMFIIFDFEEQLIHLDEKDTSFRKNIISYLSEC